MPLTGGTRFGAYEIISTLGAGGMGEVYRARDARLDRQVAIKVLPDAVVDDPDRLARFEREAKVLAALNHPLIAHVYGFEQIGDRRAIVMELVEGFTLEERTRARAARDSRRAPDRPAACRSARNGARPRHHPPRPEAGQHQADGARERAAAGE